jgi:phosphomannomutase/phosphoglucomutase
MVNPTIFREYDIRGLEASELTDEAVGLLGQAYATYMLGYGLSKVTIGRDVRLSSPRIAERLACSLVASGLEVTDLGVVPTPVFYFSLHHLQQDGGVMVTGSHNPVEYNGMKVCRGTDSIHGEEIQKLRAILERGKFRSRVGGRLARADITQVYARMLESKFARAPRPLRVVIDAGNGTAGPIAPGVFEQVGHRVTRLYCEPDGSFPHHLPDPTIPAYIQDLKTLVLSEKADFGIAYDGDGDRIGAVDDQGAIIWGDQLLALYAREILNLKSHQRIVFEVKCSQSLVDDILAHNGIPIMWKTGHSLIKAKMKEENSPLAGEMSGHIYFADDYFGFDDALYASLRLARLLAGGNRPLSALAADLPRYYATPEMRVACPDEAKFRVVGEIREHFRKTHQVIDVDGARVIFDGGWGLVRASNTQPVLVVRFEGKSPERRDSIREEFLGVLRGFGEVELLGPG